MYPCRPVFCPSRQVGPYACKCQYVCLADPCPSLPALCGCPLLRQISTTATAAQAAAASTQAPTLPPCPPRHAAASDLPAPSPLPRARRRRWRPAAVQQRRRRSRRLVPAGEARVRLVLLQGAPHMPAGPHSPTHVGHLRLEHAHPHAGSHAGSHACSLRCSLTGAPAAPSRSNKWPKRPQPASPLSHARFPLLLCPAGVPAAPAARPRRARSWWCATTRCHRCAGGVFIPRCASYVGQCCLQPASGRRVVHEQVSVAACCCRGMAASW